MEKSSTRCRLKSDRLRWTCDQSKLPLGKVSQSGPDMEIIGQERALDALRLGLAIRKPGYHIFVTGTEGTGRTTTIRRLLEEKDSGAANPTDLCYVFNFDNPDEPLLLRFPAGKGSDLERSMESFIASLRRHIPHLYRSERFQKDLGSIEKRYTHEQEEGIRAFSGRAREQGFALVELQSGPYVRPELLVMAGDEQMEIGDLEALVADERLTREQMDAIEAAHDTLTEELRSIMRANARLDEEMRAEMHRLQQSVIRPMIHDGIEYLRSLFDNQTLHGYLDQAEQALLDEQWMPADSDEEPGHEPFYRYEVNVIVDAGRSKTSPVIIETSPTFVNLFGNVERSIHPTGQPFFDYRKVKAGSLARAQGGTLVIMAQDLLDEQSVWPTLKRVLRNQKLEIQAYDPQQRTVIGSLKPQPIELDVKVILVGDSELYHILVHGDPDLKRVFRIKADFGTDMPRSAKNVRRYLTFMNKVCRQDNLLPVNRSGAGAIVEFGVELSGRHDRLSTHFSRIVDVLIESSYFARQAGARSIGVTHVDKALAEWARRMDRVEQAFRRQIRDGTVLMDIKGEVVGQVNGLFVLELQDYVFGQPMRVTATVALGESGILSIEREAELSGSSFDKGHLILSGFLRHRFAQDKPLSIAASIACEQNYMGIDGDSASSTELFALLSALSGLPASQSIAVTGSVNQFGEIQAVGAVSAKVEGFFRICREQGLDGSHGVIIPFANTKDLMLSRELVEAAGQDLFSVYAIRSVDEGMEILTGASAGRRRAGGKWTPGSVNEAVDTRLREMAVSLKQFEKSEAPSP